MAKGVTFPGHVSWSCETLGGMTGFFLKVIEIIKSLFFFLILLTFFWWNVLIMLVFLVNISSVFFMIIRRHLSLICSVLLELTLGSAT